MKYQPYMIGPVIRKLRKDRKITVESLSEMIGMSTSSINQIERGGRGLTMETLFSLMEVFECDANTILDLTEKPATAIDYRLMRLDSGKREYLTSSFVFMLDQAEQMAS